MGREIDRANDCEHIAYVYVAKQKGNRWNYRFLFEGNGDDNASAHMGIMKLWTHENSFAECVCLCVCVWKEIAKRLDPSCSRIVRTYTIMNDFQDE